MSTHSITEPAFAALPAKRYFTAAEVCELCALKPHVLRQWEQELFSLSAHKTPGPRRYYQHHEVQLIRRIRHLVYEQGFTLTSVRQQLSGVSEPDPQAAVRLSATELQSIRQDLAQVKAALDRALAS